MTQRPIPPPPTSGNSAGSSSTGATGGLGRSAPIRTIPTMMSGTAVAVATSRGGHPSAPSSGGVSLPTPAAVASATTASTAAPAVATAAIGGRTAYGPKKTVTDNVARATGTGTVAYATRNPVNPLPARQMQPVHHPLMTHTNLNPTASTVSKHDNDYPTDSRPAGAADPLELARNSGQSPPMAPLDLSSQRMHHQDLPQQPHIVPLPPPLLTPPSQQQQQQAHFHHPLENVGNYSQHQQQEMFSYQQQQKQSYYTQQQQTSAGSSSRQQHRNLSQTMSQTQTDSSHDYQQQQQPPDPPQLFQTSSFQKLQPRLVSKTQSKPQPEIQQRENLPQKTQSQMQNQPETNMQPPLQMQTQPAKTTSSQIPADPGYFETSNPKKSGFATAVATAARSAPPPPPTSSIAAPTNTTTAATETTVLRIKAPTTPDEELDVFLLAASTTATGAYSQQQNQHFHQLSQQQSPHTPKTRPAPLPAIENIVQKAQILAVRRAWGDVIRVTNDALIVKNVDGGGMPTHHDCYAELIAAASASASGSASSSSSTHASAQTPNVANTSGATRSSSEMARLRKETCQLIALRLISHAKLRRYVDLGKEVGQLGLIPHLPCHSSCTVSAGNVGKAPSVLGGDVVVDASSIVPPSPVEDSELVSFSAVATGHTSSTMDSLSWKEGSLHHLTSHPSSYPEKDPTPSWVPYGLRILAAQQLQYSDGGSKAVDVLYDMMDRVTRTEYWDGARAGEIKNVKTNEYGSGSMEVWKSTISNALVNTFVRKREWRMALRCLEDMLDGLEHGVEREVDWWCRGGGKNDSYDAGFDTSPSDNDEPNENSTRSNMSDAERQQMKELITSSATVELLSRQLLILLQSGAIRAAEILQIDLRYHTSKVKEWTSSFNFQSDPSSPSSMTTMFRLHRESALVRQAPLRQMLNEGLLHFARFQYSAAMNCFRDVLNQQKELRAIVSSTTANHPSGCPTWKDMTYPTLGFDAEPTLTVECLNNFSLCLLYSCNMRMAVNEMEGLIREDPALYLTEGMAFNLCTLYELGSDGEDCVRRKKILQRVAKRFFLHDVGVESFRLS